MEGDLTNRRSFLGAGAAIAFLPLIGCGESNAAAQTAVPADPAAANLIAAARAQIGVTMTYDPAYTALAFPNGDVPRGKGVCTDVIIRAYRDALGLDLQALVNADMRAAFGQYPTIWGLSRPDKNIDHRRVPNLRKFFTRAEAELPVPRDFADWQPGDVVTSMVGGRLPHIGIVSDRRAGDRPLIIHNIGRGTQEEDILPHHPINGRYRWRVGQNAPVFTPSRVRTY
jgi:uncharacterized protein